jgi:hypothetical protein
MHRDILNFINEHNLVSVMNNTKWNKLATAIVANDNKEPCVRVKFLRENEPTGFSLMEWNLEVHNCTLFEWIDIDPIKRIRVGGLVPDKEINLTSHVLEILNQNNIPYSIENGMYRVWGYYTSGNVPTFV